MPDASAEVRSTWAQDPAYRPTHPFHLRPYLRAAGPRAVECNSSGRLDEVAYGLGVSDAGGRGAAADEFLSGWPHGHVLVAAAARIVGDKGDLADVDGE